MLSRFAKFFRAVPCTYLTAVLVAISTAVAAAPGVAQETARVQERIHVVQRGETLWDLARDYLGDSFLWPEIYRLNAAVIQDPARIEPGERLRIPGFVPGEVVQAPGEPTPRDTGLRFAVREARPFISPGDFYGAALLIPDSEVTPVGRVAAVEDPSVIPRRTPTQIQLYDLILIPLDGAATVAVGDRMHLFRRTRRVEPHGRVYLSTGIATVAAIEDGTASATVVQMYDVISVGDLVVPVMPFPVTPGVVPVAADGVGGTILAFQSQHPLQSVKDAVFLNVGQNSGVREGDEFMAFLPKQQESWGVRPAVDVARLRVVRVAGETATARIVNMEHPAVQIGMPIRLVGKMP